MSNDLVPFDQLNTMAQAFANSQMFGAKTKEQALSLLLLAQAEGVHPAIAMRDFDIINGRPAKKAEAMHRSFIAAGGKIEWHALTDALADATFRHESGGTARITWDLERAKKAGLAGRDMYGKYARQMLRSRVVSEGCRTVYPAATSGLYVPEEVKTFEPPKEKDMGPAQVVEEPTKVTPEQIEAIKSALRESVVEISAFLTKADIQDIGELMSADAPNAIAWIRKQRKTPGPAVKEI